jgi:CheY-like chemotaxis protein/Tfp pilus assembly protein PilZ
MAVDRRKSARYPLVLAVSWAGAGGRPDHTEDLSASGLFIRTDRALAAGERVPVELSFPGLLERLDLVVEVVRRREAGPQRPAGLGVAVPEERSDERARLEALARAAAGSGFGGSRAYRILLVEDNALVASMYASALRRLSATEGLPWLEVETADDGDRALLRLEGQPPIDLVITDVYMPALDGLGLLERIRAHERLQATPVVVISSGTADEDQRAIRAGAQIFLRKPVRYQDIVATVRALLAAGIEPRATP